MGRHAVGFVDVAERGQATSSCSTPSPEDVIRDAATPRARRRAGPWAVPAPALSEGRQPPSAPGPIVARRRAGRPGLMFAQPGASVNRRASSDRHGRREVRPWAEGHAPVRRRRRAPRRPGLRWERTSQRRWRRRLPSGATGRATRRRRGQDVRPSRGQLVADELGTQRRFAALRRAPSASCPWCDGGEQVRPASAVGQSAGPSEAPVMGDGSRVGRTVVGLLVGRRSLSRFHVKRVALPGRAYMPEGGTAAPVSVGGTGRVFHVEHHRRGGGSCCCSVAVARFLGGFSRETWVVEVEGP